MAELKVITYEESRLEYFRKQRDSAERRINYWCRPKQANRVGWMEASDRASEAGMQYNFYKDALEALAAQPKWISVEERLPEDGTFALFHYAKNGENTMDVGCYYDYGMFMVDGHSVNATHWMPLPEPPKEEE